MSQAVTPRVFKYPTVIVAVVGGIALMSIASIAQGLSFGFGNLTFISLMTFFVLGGSITFIVLRLLQQRLDSLHDNLQDQFDLRTEELKKTEDRFQEYAESSTDWFWETDSENRFVFFSTHLYEAMGISSEDVLGKRREDLRIAAANPEEEVQWENYLPLRRWKVTSRRQMRSPPMRPGQPCTGSSVQSSKATPMLPRNWSK